MLRMYGSAHSVIMILGGQSGPVLVGRCRPKRKNMGRTGNMPSATVVLEKTIATGINGIHAITLRLGLPLTLPAKNKRVASALPIIVSVVMIPWM